MKKILKEIYATLLFVLICGCLIVGLAITGGVEVGTIDIARGIKGLAIISVIGVLAIFGVFGLYKAEKAEEEEKYIKRTPGSCNSDQAHKKIS